ncbi:MAG: ATPase central domain-containing protein [Marinobacter sp. T13-3]|nr:MAG: ATPase central domain-containing protein [Marinobacter sp. T13-3]
MKWTDLIDQHVETPAEGNPNPDAKMLLQLYVCRLMTAPDANILFCQKDAIYQANLLELEEVRGVDIPEGPITDQVLKTLNFQPPRLGDNGHHQDEAAIYPYPTIEAFKRSLKNRQAELEQQLRAAPQPPVLGFNALLETLKTRLTLTQVETKILTLAILSIQFHWVRNLLIDINTLDTQHSLRVLEYCLREPVSAILVAVDKDKSLVLSGLLKAWKSGHRENVDEFLCPGAVLRKVTESLAHDSGEHEDAIELILQTICPFAPRPSFPLSAFSGVGDLQLVIDYLRQALEQSRQGTNVLLYGPPGTGKTELARALASHLGSSLYEVPTVGECQTSLTGSERLDSAYVAQSFLKDRPGVVLLFDEMEDAFRDHRELAKGWLNKLLEQNRVPTIWISNRVDHIDPAFLRRFTLVLPVKDNGSTRMTSIVDTLKPLPVSKDWSTVLAKKPWMTLALASNLREVGALLPANQPQRNQQRLQSVLEDRLTLARGESVNVSIEPQSRESSGLVFSGEWLNTKPSLRNVERMLRRGQPARLCLYGPPGAGKTAYASELADRIGHPFKLVSGSDLQSCFVGETEKNIVGIFAEAERSGAVLLLDEADTFLFDRETANRSWEVSMTNEFMVRMERFKGVFLATTNRMDSLDSAVMRRFQLKVRFGYLAPAQLKGLLATCVVDADRVSQLPDSALAHFTAVTPGLIQAALSQLQLLGLRPKLDRLLTALEEEQALQSGSFSHRAIGFHA